jgi:hypothetical protein
MRGIGCKQKAADSKRIGTSLMQFVRTCTGKFIVAGLGLSGQNLFVSSRETGKIFFI